MKRQVTAKCNEPRFREGQVWRDNDGKIYRLAYDPANNFLTWKNTDAVAE